jgi:hypothetical protein
MYHVSCRWFEAEFFFQLQSVVITEDTTQITQDYALGCFEGEKVAMRGRGGDREMGTKNICLSSSHVLFLSFVSSTYPL